MKAPKAIKSAINKFEHACKRAFENAWKKTHIRNLKKKQN